MHRQSLGSPAAKLHPNGIFIKETHSPISPAEELLLLQKKLVTNEDEDEKEKNKKKAQKTTPSRHPEKFIHLIPILTLLCIFILYLNSHDPSQNDLAQFTGFKPLSRTLDSTNIEKFQRVLEIEKGEILALRSMRNLQEVDKETPKYRINRKIGDF